jgi:hypothetical protein
MAFAAVGKERVRAEIRCDKNMAASPRLVAEYAEILDKARNTKAQEDNRAVLKSSQHALPPGAKGSVANCQRD